MKTDPAMQSGSQEVADNAGTRRPRWWPHFRSPLRSTAVTARLGRALGICFGVCFVTGLLSHYQYHPWSWLPEPANPVQAYRVTQGLHVATGVAAIPLLLVKLWSVYPNLFRWPPIRSVKHALERLSVFVLISSALVQLTTGFLNTLDWYPWPWSFPSTHRYLALRVDRFDPPARRAEAAGHQVRPAGEACRCRRADRDPVEREPVGAQQRRHGCAAGDAGDGPTRSPRRGRLRHRCRRAHHDRPDRHSAGAHRPARDQTGLEGSAGRPGEQDRQVGARAHVGQGRRLAARGDGPHALHPHPGRARVDGGR